MPLRGSYIALFAASLKVLIFDLKLLSQKFLISGTILITERSGLERRRMEPIHKLVNADASILVLINSPH